MAGGAVSSSTRFVTTTWAHIACVYDGANLRLYRNGTLVASGPATGIMVTTARMGLHICSNNRSGDPFDGDLNGLRLWRVARSVGLLCTQPSDCG